MPYRRELSPSRAKYVFEFGNMAIRVRKVLEGKVVSFIKSDAMRLSSGHRDEAHLLALMSHYTMAAQCAPGTLSCQGSIQSPVGLFLLQECCCGQSNTNTDQSAQRNETIIFG